MRLFGHYLERGPIIIFVVVLLLLAVLAFFGYDYWTSLQ